MTHLSIICVCWDGIGVSQWPSLFLMTDILLGASAMPAYVVPMMGNPDGHDSTVAHFPLRKYGQPRPPVDVGCLTNCEMNCRLSCGELFWPASPDSTVLNQSRFGTKNTG